MSWIKKVTCGLNGVGMYVLWVLWVFAFIAGDLLMPHGNSDAILIGIALFVGGAIFMALMHFLVEFTHYWLNKLDKRP